MHQIEVNLPLIPPTGAALLILTDVGNTLKALGQLSVSNKEGSYHEPASDSCAVVMERLGSVGDRTCLLP
jgi:hypothetical protein